MSLTRLENKKEEVYNIAPVFLNVFLIFAVIMVTFELVVPLLGGKLSVYALMAYGSWIGIALAGKIILKRARNGLNIRWHDYALMCLCAIVNLAIWFAYPVNIILGILCIIVAAVAYRRRAQ